MLYTIRKMESLLEQAEWLVARCEWNTEKPTAVVREGLELARELIGYYRESAGDIFGLTDAESVTLQKVPLQQIELYLEPVFNWVLMVIKKHDIQIADYLPGIGKTPKLVDPDANASPLTLADRVGYALDWIVSEVQSKRNTFSGIEQNLGQYIYHRMPYLYQRISSLVKRPAELNDFISNRSGYSVTKGYAGIPYLTTPIGPIHWVIE